MALPRDGNDAAEGGGDEPIPVSRISTILFVIAMQTEASPLVNKFQLTEEADSMDKIWQTSYKSTIPLDILLFPVGVPWVRYFGKYKNMNINIVCPGKDKALGVDSVGTVPASLVTFASIQNLQPDIIINAGTAGGFKAKGASIGDVFLASHVAFHDRRNPLPMQGIYCIGSRQAFSTPNLAKELNIKVAKLSTGNSLDMIPQDAARITANDATIKDMEGAAIAYVSDLLKIPTIYLKAVTDIVDGDKPTAEEFLRNLATATAVLGHTATQMVDFIDGKALSDL